MKTCEFRLRTPKETGASSVGGYPGASPLVAAVLSARGFSPSEADALLRRELLLHDPFLLPDMAKAVELVTTAIESNLFICVFGDYDCDGVCATAMVASYLENVGARFCYYIPHREREGYGLNKAAVEELSRMGVDVIITVDTGISSFAEVQLAQSLGMEVLITDHHTPPAQLPDAAIVDPHLVGSRYPFSQLCGTGVAFKLLCALEGENGYDLLEQYGDLLAIATVADVVELKGENRAFVQAGLPLLQESNRVGVRALLEVAGLANTTLTAESVAFGLSPRINAAGRLDTADIATMLLLTESVEEAQTLAQQLDDFNQARKELEKRITEDIQQQLVENPALAQQQLPVFWGQGWNAGVVGIVCSRLVERFERPVLLIACDGAEAKGSGRSVEGFSLIAAITACKSHLNRFGGHPMAAGFSLATVDIPAFSQALNHYCAALAEPIAAPGILADCIIDPALLTVPLVEGLAALEPFGCGNEQPLFALRSARVQKILPLSQGKHCKLALSVGGSTISALCFFASPQSLGVMEGDVVDLAFSPSINLYQGNKSVSLKCACLCLSGVDYAASAHGRQQFDAFCRGEVLGKEAIPTRAEIAVVYRALKTPCAVSLLETLYHRLSLTAPLDYLRFRLAIAVLLELGPLQAEEGVIRLNPTSPKVDLASSAIIRSLSEHYEG